MISILQKLAGEGEETNSEVEPPPPRLYLQDISEIERILEKEEKEKHYRCNTFVVVDSYISNPEKKLELDKKYEQFNFMAIGEKKFFEGIFLEIKRISEIGGKNTNVFYLNKKEVLEGLDYYLSKTRQPNPFEVVTLPLQSPSSNMSDIQDVVKAPHTSHNN